MHSFAFFVFLLFTFATFTVASVDDPVYELQIGVGPDIYANYRLSCQDFHHGYNENLIPSFTEFLKRSTQVVVGTPLLLSYLSDMIMQRIWKQRSTISMDIAFDDKVIHIEIPWCVMFVHMPVSTLA